MYDIPHLHEQAASLPPEMLNLLVQNRFLHTQLFRKAAFTQKLPCSPVHKFPICIFIQTCKRLFTRHAL